MSRAGVAPSARSSAELEGATLAFKAMGRELRNTIKRESRARMNPTWRELVALQIGGDRRDARTLGKGVRIDPGNPVQLRAGTTAKAIKGNPIPEHFNHIMEFGDPNRFSQTSTYDRSGSRTRSHTVTRHARTGLPKAARAGRVVYQAAADIIPRFVSLWVQIVIRNIHESIEGRN